MRYLKFISFPLEVLVFLITLVAVSSWSYYVRARFDTVEEAKSYVIRVGVENEATASLITSECEVIVPGGLDYKTTSVWVEAIADGKNSGPSNTLYIEPQKTECQQMDLSGDDKVTVSDALILLKAVVELKCE